jgi:type IV pilus assembly protein PilM
MKKFLLDFFPPPDYLLMPAVGVDVSDRSLKYIEISKRNKIFFVSRFKARSLVPGIVELGEIKQKEKLIVFLKSIKEEIKTKFVNVSLPEEKAFLGRIKLPVMREEEIRNMLEFQLEEHVPLSPQDAIFDFEIVNRSNERKKEGYLNVNIVAFPRTLVEDYRDVFVAAGFTPLAFEMEAHAFARAVVPKEEKDSFLVMDFGKTRTTFAIVSDGKMQFASTVKIGGDNLNSALVSGLGVEFLRAEEIKKIHSFINNKENEKIFNLFLPIISAIKDEMSKNITYWNSHLEEENSEKIIKKYCFAEVTPIFPAFPII